MTPTLRQNDIDLVMIGADVNEEMMIPPHFDSNVFKWYSNELINFSKY